MFEEALAWEHPEDLPCLFAPLWGVPARNVLSYPFCFTCHVLWILHRFCMKNNLKKLIRSFRNTPESFFFFFFL